MRKVAQLLNLSKPARLRLEWNIWYEAHGQNARSCARHFGIAPKTFHKWRKLFDEANLRTLEDRSKAPHKLRSRDITSLQETRVVALRKQYLRYGKEKLVRIYETQYGEPISSWKVQKVIEKHKLYYHPAKNARTQQKRKRAEKKKRIAELSIKNRTGFLFRLDTIVRYWHGTRRYILTAVDTSSRLAFAHMYQSHSSFASADFLRRLYAVADGKIENIQTDNGSEFQGEFTQTMRELGIPHYFSRVRTPKDNAPNERFNRTLQEEFIAMGNMVVDSVEFNRRLTEWLIEYNFHRPHQSLGYLTPMYFISKQERLLPMWSSSTQS